MVTHLSIMKSFTLQNDCALIYEALTKQWLYFSEPSTIYQTFHTEEVYYLLEYIQKQVDQKKMYAVGFVSYEALGAFDKSYKSNVSTKLPLLWFGLYSEPELYDFSFFHNLKANFLPDINWKSTVSESEYQKAIKRIKDLIRKGESYQVNYSLRFRTSSCFDPWNLFLQMLHQQGKNNYGAFLSTKDWAICSASPELFFRLHATRIRCRPMKGTSPRGLEFTSDRQQSQNLRTSIKERAGNAMIVDMVRNDLGKICKKKSIRINELYTLEQYPTVWQMTSEVQGRTSVGFAEIFEALFPAASVTGTPKTQTLKIISDLEKDAREIYTGAIGIWGPKRRAQFNTAIRTVWVDRKKNEAHYGTGGGIVWDSTQDSEWKECLLKIKMLDKAVPPFSLLETLLWNPKEGYFLLDYHIKRLTETAIYFGYSVNINNLYRELKELSKNLTSSRFKIRLLVNMEGKISLEKEEIFSEQNKKEWKVALSKSPVNSEDPFLYHKTTHRKVYDDAMNAFPNYDDVILWNEKEELTESTIGNLAIEIEEELFTPPVSCGLLAGTYRASLLEKGLLSERVLSVKDLSREHKIYLLNSVHKSWEITL